MIPRSWLRPALLLLLVGWFWLESWLFLVIGGKIGLLPVLAWVFFTFVLGAVLLRVEGLRMLFQMHVQLQRGIVPAREMLSGMAIVLGALLLMLPGYFTDTLGLLLLFPPTRWLLWLIAGGPLVRFATPSNDPAQPRRPSEEIIEIKAQPLDRI